MFGLTESMRYYLCPRYIGMGAGIDKLYSIVKNEMKRNPLSGEVYLFTCKKRTTMKLLHWENGGFVLYQKRLEEGSFELPRFKPSQGPCEIEWRRFILIMEGVSIRSVTYRKRFLKPPDRA